MSKNAYPDKYFVYIVYNIHINKAPILIEVDGNYVEKFKSEKRHRDTIDIHKVHDHVKTGRLKQYDLPLLTKEMKQKIRIFIKTSTGIPHAEILEHLYKIKYNNFVKFIQMLGPDIRPEAQHRRCFSYISEITGARCPLVWLYPKRKPVEDIPFRVNVKHDSPKEAPHIRYPVVIETITKYQSRTKTSDWYVNFYVFTDDDLEKAKQIIQFAYENL